MKIAVIYGGISSEREVSINTGKEIINNLDKSKYEVIGLELEKAEDIFKLRDMNVDFVYIALHGIFGEDGRVQAILDSMNIPYSGCGVLSSAMSMDKNISKLIVKNSGVRVIDGISVRKGDKINFSDLNLGDKVILKPNSGGSSIGINFATNQEEFEKALNEIFLIDDEALVERIMKGIEISVPIIKDTFFDYKSKYENGGALEYVHEFEKELQNEIDDFTRKVYKSLKCKGYARVDYILVDNRVYFLEINTLPGMTKNSLLPKSTLSKGYSYTQTLNLLIEASTND